MYFLLYQDTNELVADFESRHSAMMCAQILSLEKLRAIVVVYNGVNGETADVMVFENGQQQPAPTPPGHHTFGLKN